MSHRHSPDEDVSFCLLWIKACAVSPLVRFSITIAIGRRLSQILGAKLDEELVLTISRTAWFRAAYMPRALRIELISSLGEDSWKVVLEAWRAATFSVLLEHVSWPDLAGRSISTAPIWWNQLCRELCLFLPKSHYLADDLTLCFLGGYKLSEFRLWWIRFVIKRDDRVRSILRKANLLRVVALVLTFSFLLILL